MTGWQLTAFFNFVITGAYFVISYIILSGLVRTKQLRTNPLALAVSMIFFTCAVHHQLLVVHLAFGDQVTRDTFGGVHHVLWDLVGAGVAVWFLSLRRTYGRLLGSPVMFEDVHKRAYEERLAAQQAELERSNAELARFASGAAHDLSEPLNTMRGFVSMLEREEGERSPRERAYVTQISEGAERMQSLIDGMLRVSRAGAGHLERERVDLAEVARRTVADLRARIETTGARVEIGPLPEVEGDPRALGQVLQNLLANALKFTTRGASPQVEVSARDEGRLWRIEVADRGPGVAEQDHERIFGMFARGARTEGEDGAGIGLGLCARLVGQMGGSIGVEDRPGGGSVFAFTVPALVDEATEGVAVDATVRPAAA